MKKNLKTHVDLIIFAFLIILAFVLSGYWILYNPQRPLPDPTLYEGIAANLAEGNGFSFDSKPPFRPELTRAPFLPAFISVIYKIIGRHPEAVLWMNAFLIGLAVAIGYLLALKLFKDRRIAVVGAFVAFLTPPVTGSANNILTEPLAMLQMVAISMFLLEWPRLCRSKWAALYSALLGILLATLVLNRSSMTFIAMIAAGYAALVVLRGRFRSAAAWLTASALAVALGTPVLLWSARNASLGLSFSPAPIGLYASRVLDMKRYQKHLLDPGQKLPAVNDKYFLHWKRHYGPEKLKELETENKKWFETWAEKHRDRIWRSMPYRLVGLFSFFRNTIYPPWPYERDQEMREVMRWISRSLWLMSLAGMVLCFRNRPARWIWLLSIIPLIAVHLFTVCHPRYMDPVMPMLMPYGGVTLVRAWDKARRFLGSVSKG